MSTININHSNTLQYFAFKEVSRNPESDTEALTVAELLDSSKFVLVSETNSFSFPNFPEAKKSFQVYYLDLHPNFSAFTGLFKGLIYSGKPEGVILEHNRELGNYTLKYYDSKGETVKNYLQKIFGVLDEEIRFKAILRKVIQNQKRINMEEQLLRQELFSV